MLDNTEHNAFNLSFSQCKQNKHSLINPKHKLGYLWGGKKFIQHISHFVIFWAEVMNPYRKTLEGRKRAKKKNKKTTTSTPYATNENECFRKKLTSCNQPKDSNHQCMHTYSLMSLMCTRSRSHINVFNQPLTTPLPPSLPSHTQTYIQ